MESCNAPKSPDRVAGTPDKAIPRWTCLPPQPRISGFVTFEWNIKAGTTWYSDEWAALTQSDDYDWAYPNAQEWWTSRIHPEDLPIVERACLAVIAGLVEKTDVTYRLKRGDGSWRWLVSRGQVSERSPDGTPLIVSGACMDLTDQYAEGCELRGSSSVSDFDYHAMLENSPDLFIRLTRELTPIYANPVIVRYMRSAEDKGTTDTDKGLRIKGDYKALLKRNVEKVFQERAITREHISITLSDGGEVYGECSFWPESDADGKVRYAMMQFRDLTESRRMEQRIRLDEQRRHTLYKLTCMENASEDEVLQFALESVLRLTDSRNGFIFIPDAEASETGKLLWSIDRSTSLDPAQLPTDRLPEDLLAQLMDLRGAPRYRSINNGDGKTPLCHVFNGNLPIMRSIIAPAKEENRVTCIAGVCNKAIDYEEVDLQQLETFLNGAWLILRRRRFIHELQAAKEAAVTANKAKNAFLANVSHELRTPLNGVLSMLQLIDTMPMGSQQKEYLMIAQSSGKALLRIISDLLDYSCMESGRMPLAVELFDCRDVFRSSLSVFEKEASRKGLRFTYRLDAAIPQYLLGDGERVRQILFNIVGNAFKFTAEGGITVTCNMLDQAPEGKLGIGISVADTGIGIPENKLTDIFDAFSQVENYTGAKHAGTGLGLSIVKHLVNMMGGSISARSRLGIGTTFDCSLFFDLPASPPQGAHCGEETKAKTRPQSLDILVAEDDQVGSFALRSFLQRSGHRVVCVADGIQALEALQLHPFHCVFTDIAMPRMDGLDLVQHVRAGRAALFPPSEEVRHQIQSCFPQASGELLPINPATVVVAVTAHTMSGDKERFLAHGIDLYISKPIISSELQETLRQAASKLRLTEK